MDQNDLELFRRSLAHATGAHTGPALDGALAGLGWSDALAVDRRAAVASLFELQGGANVTSSALAPVLAAGAGHPLDAGVGVVLPAIGTHDAPGRWDGAQLAVRGLALAGLGDLPSTLVVAPAGDGHGAVVVDTAALSLRPVAGVDPALGLLEVTGDVEGVAEGGPADWPAATALGRLAVGHELVGAARRMLELAREHALDRIQFGVPIATFQAVRHRLAESLVAVEMADAVLDAAWLDGSPATAAMAKAAAGRGARTAARHCQQVLAGIGFTTEHELHRHVRRVLVLEQLLGATKSLTREVGAEALRSGRLPAVLPL